MKKFLGMIALVAVVTFSFAGSGFAWDSYWSKEKWPEGKANGVVPPCGVNVLPLGGDDILQATVDTYCGLNPGKYKSFINPAVKKIYDSNGTKYPDGITAILELKDIKAAFVTSHKGGKPVYDAISLETGKSIASHDKGHPLNPQTCANCHASFDKACIKRGYTCGNR